MPSYDRALWALRKRLDSWPGVGHVAVEDGWRRRISVESDGASTP